MHTCLRDMHTCKGGSARLYAAWLCDAAVGLPTAGELVVQGGDRTAMLDYLECRILGTP